MSKSEQDKATVAHQFAAVTRFLQAKLTSHFLTVFIPKDQYGSGLPDVIFQLTQGKTTYPKKYAIALTAMTEAELQVTQEMFNVACELAKPLVKYRDAVAEEKRDDDSLIENLNSRLYRSLPSVVLGKRALGQYDPSVFDGFKDALERVGIDLPVAGTLREPGRGMAEYGTETEESSDAP